MKVKITDNFTISIHEEGIVLCGVFLFLTITSLMSTGLHTLTLIFLICSYFLISFFRDPERVIPSNKNVIVSPADGTIIDITRSVLPKELELNDSNEYTKISIFLSPLDVHIQRIPVDSVVEKIKYISGLFISATLDKSSVNNERNIVLLKNKSDDKRICVVQIAGIVARRIVSYLKDNDECKIGNRYGIIKFGSRVEVYLPLNYNISVLKGQTLIAGETVIGGVGV